MVTYTAHLPFPVGIPNELGHTLLLSAPFKDEGVTEYFGTRPYVRIRVYDTVERGLPMLQKGTHAAIEHFYGVQLYGDPCEIPLFILGCTHTAVMPRKPRSILGPSGPCGSTPVG